MIRFHLDENVDHAIANGLLRRGINVTTSTDAGLLHASDKEQLAFASEHRRVIITHDQDFLRLHASGMEHAGIAYCRHRSRTISEIISALVIIHDCLTPGEMQGQVEFL